MNYNEAIEYIHGTKKFGSKLGLDNIRHLLKLMGDPHEELKFIHVAGTNGKGSTSSYITSILKEANYRVGLFTSPYLEKFTERIRINDDNIPDGDLARIVVSVKEKVEEMVEDGFNHPTEFEIVTAIALQYFKETNVDFVVLEVGLGGRYDSTNVINSTLVSVITPIGMDHTDILGDTLSKIAYEKAGIIKNDSFVISYPQKEEALEVVKSVANEKNADLTIVPMENLKIKSLSQDGSKFDFKYNNYDLRDLNAGLLGEHQAYNASTALTTILAMRDKGFVNVTEEEIRKGLENTKWMGRLEVVRRKPTFVIDGAHNVEGIESLRKALDNVFKYNRLILGVGMLADKDVENMIPKLVEVADEVITTTPNIFRAMEGRDLAKIVKKYNENCIAEENIEKAIEKAMEIANEDDLIVFAGSLYLIGDVRKIIMAK
ncbi:bifunctional folylpolyglutamate synthase/dihydrofolate synthase [Dethiothermospora halolimnae]|uniref:bifunctional folylpolyglutamate synthase/dihydrofolate synthase n=1 Tax=Dethiothermospora halolimnae TaxID=3114390 RepID=UPI003CCC2A5C